jgi:hypothetical protein
MKTNWYQIRTAQRFCTTRTRVVRPTGWKGGYNRKPPTGEHKCLPRTDMLQLIASWK